MMLRIAVARGLNAALLIMASVQTVCAQVPDERCIECHSQVAIMLTKVQFADGEAISPFVDRDGFLQSAHGTLSCMNCHEQCHPEFQADFEPSNQPAHSLPTRREYALAITQKCLECHQAGHEGVGTPISEVLHPTGNDESPLCSDCHQPHAMQRVESRGVAIDQACANCHEDIYRDFRDSAHGAALGDPANLDLPRCTSCHSGHQEGGKSLAAQRVRLGRPCMGCHGDEQLMGHYDLSTDVVRTYLDDFHGVSVKFYGKDALSAGQFTLVCADCHGIHDVKPTRGLAATALKARLDNVCRKCHENASENFSQAWLSHSKPSLSSNVLVYLVRIGYLVLIPFVITGLAIHIISHLVVLPMRKRAREAAGTSVPSEQHASHSSEPTGQAVPKYFVRFSRRQRAEHLMVLTTFVLLIATGLPQKFHESAWAEMMIRLFGGIDSARLVHRVAGFALTAVSIFHLVTVATLILLRKTRMTMLPVRKDFEDAIETMKYYLGLADSAPKADRFTYGEKFEYWGMILGTVVMVASGFLLLYPTVLTAYLPGQLIAAAKVAHSFEAMMALLTIVVWHMYGARFDPCIFTGKISRERLQHHHPLEYERLVHQVNRTAGNGSPVVLPAASLATSPIRQSSSLGADRGSLVSGGKVES
jgi:formate dehydrogenase subunit gamma